MLHDIPKQTGKKVLVFKIRSQKNPKARQYFKGRPAFVPLSPYGLELPYEDFSERGLASFLFENYGEGIFEVRSWRWDRKHKMAHLFNLIRMEVFDGGNGIPKWNVYRIYNIHKFKAWRDNQQLLLHKSYF